MDIKATEPWAMAVTLDPYTKDVSMLTDEGPVFCSYQEAVENPNISRYLSHPMLETINASLEAEKMAGDR